MKHQIKAFILFSLSLAFWGQAEAQRNVYWVHGLNGQADRWQRYADKFQADRQMVSHTPAFASTGSVDEITDGIDSQFGTNPPPDNIGIGASLGGIVVRNLERRGGDANEIGGIITSHSPNQGAAIATAVNNGGAEAHLNNAINTIAEALREINEHLSNDVNSIWDGILGGLNAIIGLPNEFLNVTIELIASSNDIPSEEEITSQIITAFNIITDPATQGIYQDIDPNNGFMPALNSYPSTLPHIEIHGYETDKEPFRMGCSQEKMVWALPLAETVPITDDDCQVFQDLKDGESQLQSAQDALNIKGALNILNPVSWLRKKRRSSDLFHAAQDVKDAKNMIGHGLEEGWESLMFGAVPVTVTQSQLTGNCQVQISELELDLLSLGADGHPHDPDDPYPPAAAAILQQIKDLMNDPGCYEDVPVTIYVNDPDARYDGLFLDAEQVTGSALAEYENSPVVVNGKEYGVNHVEALNHPRTWFNLNDIFDSDTFFNTPPK